MGIQYLLLLLILVCHIIDCTKFEVQLTSYRVETPGALESTSDSGQSTIFSDEETNLRLYFFPNISSNLIEISFTNIPKLRGDQCTDFRLSSTFQSISSVEYSKVYKVLLAKRDGFLDIPLMFCIGPDSEGAWIHQGNLDILQLIVVSRKFDNAFPLWLKCLLIPIFVIISAIACSFLHTYFMLSRDELKLVKNIGNHRERYFVKAIYPMRKRANFMYCSILCCKIISDVIISVLLYSLIGIYSILAASLIIIIFCDYIPVILSSKFGLLKYGLSNMVWMTNLYCILTFYISYLLGRLLDSLFKNDIPFLIERNQFMINKNSEIINSNANDKKMPDFYEKSVSDIMIHLNEAYMEEYNTTLTNQTLGRIKQMGYSCIPIYETEKQNIVAVLHVKDLALINQIDNVSVKTLCKYYNRPVNFVFEDTKLNIMLEEFKKGQSSIAFVQHINNEGVGDPFYETLGFVTLKDVIDQIFSMNSITIPYKENIDNDWDHLPSYEELRDMNVLKRNLPKNLALAAQHFLSSSVPSFNPKLIDENVLERLISQSCNFLVYNSTSPALIEKGKPCNSFLLILDGYVHVYIGAENFAFDSGPFSHFALSTLPSVSSCPVNAASTEQSLDDSIVSSSYTPDFSVCATTDLTYLRITSAMYMMALRTSLLTFQHTEREASYSIICSDMETDFHEKWGKSAASPMDSDSVLSYPPV